MLSIGDPAPAFTLPDTDGTPLSLTDLKGHKRLIVFIPNPFTGVCDEEGCALRDDLPRLEELEADVVVITCHARPTNRKWADEHGFDFPVLSDFWPHGNVSRAYGTFNEDLGIANRTTYVVDAAGVVRDIIASRSLGRAREQEAYAEALHKL
jgi:peroxiredoxin (alkyl hydroperoxide reductase subunit C)